MADRDRDDAVRPTFEGRTSFGRGSRPVLLDSRRSREQQRIEAHIDARHCSLLRRMTRSQIVSIDPLMRADRKYDSHQDVIMPANSLPAGHLMSRGQPVQAGSIRVRWYRAARCRSRSGSRLPMMLLVLVTTRPGSIRIMRRTCSR